MRLIKLTSIACLALPDFTTLSHKRHDFRENVTKHKTRLLIFSISLSENFLTLRIIQLDVINVYMISSKVPIILLRLSRNLDFLNRFSKNTQISNYMKISPMGTELFDVDAERMDRHDKADFAKAPKNGPSRNRMGIENWNSQAANGQRVTAVYTVMNIWLK
jgi:hypothetical protein